jgi:hypothetical protein
MLVTLAMPGLASAAPFSVESPTHVAREQADQLRKSAIGAGADAERTRIVRRYERGAGWRYLVQVDSVPTMDEVDTLAGVLTDGARTPRVVDLATGGVVAVRAPVQAAEPTAQPSTKAPTAVEPADSSDRRSRREAEGVLGAAVVAHGGVAGGLDLLEGAPQVTFQFIREVPVDDGVLKAKHVYRQAGDASRLDVSVQKGKGVDSTTVVAPTGGAWVITNDQRVSRDTDRAKDIVGRFAPDQLLRVALGVAADIETATAWRELQVIGPEGDDLVVLRPDGGPVGGLVEVAFARSDHRLRRLHIREGDRETIYFFDDYREVSPGLVVPHESEVHRDGKFIESIQVLALDISEPIPASLFSQSGG